MYVTYDIYKIVFNLRIQSPDPYHCIQNTIRSSIFYEVLQELDIPEP